MSPIAFIFPGQGSQYVGMGKDFYDNFKESRYVFEEANHALSMDLSGLCFNGTEDDLKKTENTQPAILATSMAMLKVMEKEGICCEYTAGLSLGEYTSMVLADSLKFSDALKIVRKRGKIMQEAVPLGIGGMVAIIGLDNDKLPLAIKASEEYGIVEIANYNSPGQIVISGELKGLKIASEEAIKLGAKKVIPLLVSGPFHSSLLIEAGKRLEDELLRYEIREPNKNIISNVDAKIIADKKEIIPKLVRQVSSSVLWQQSVEFMINEGVDTFIEIGPGKSLTGFIKRIKRSFEKDIKTINVSDIKSFSNMLRALEGGN